MLRVILFRHDGCAFSWLSYEPAIKLGGAGSVEIELRERGKPIEGFSFGDCAPFLGDEIWVNCRWKGREDLKELLGRSLELAVRLRSAKIFACGFV